MDNNYNQNNFNNTNYNSNIPNTINNNGKQKTNKNAIYALVFSIVSIFIFWWLSIAGISSGVLALREIKNKNEKGKALAIIGIVIGVIALVLKIYFDTINT